MSNKHKSNTKDKTQSNVQQCEIVKEVQKTRKGEDEKNIIQHQTMFTQKREDHLELTDNYSTQKQS